MLPYLHWQTPASLVAALGLACLFAFTHHFLYSHFAGRVVEETRFSVAGLSATQQQLIIAGGTAIAFCVKVGLGMTLSLAYLQAFWRAVGSKDTTIKTLDILSTATENIRNLLWLKVWLRYPSLFLLATSSWLIPIASIVTPAAISIAIAPVLPSPSSMFQVPSIDFESLKLIVPGELSSVFSPNSTMMYNGPQQSVERLIRSTSLSGTMPSLGALSPPVANASWSTLFNGPSVKCTDLDSTLQEAVEENIIHAFVNGSTCQNCYNFLSWTATPGVSRDSNGNSNATVPNILPFPQHAPYDHNVGTLGPLTNTIGDSPQAADDMTVAAIYFAILPDFTALSYSECNMTQFAEPIHNTISGATFLQCQLYNTTYNASFSISDGTQIFTGTNIGADTATPLTALSEVTLSTGSLRNGSITCGAVNAESTACLIDPVTLQHLSLQAIMDAFGRVMVGTVQAGDSYNRGTFVDSTSILSTPLINLPDLAFLAQSDRWQDAGQERFSNGSAEFQSLYSWNQDSWNVSLAEGLEELFQTVTLSLLTLPDVQPNATSPLAPAMVVVTSNLWQSVYVYAQTTFWLCYGLAILTAAAGAVFGLFCIVANDGASFSKSFSTVLRATRHAEMSVEVDDEDRKGWDPLPEYLADAKVALDVSSNSVMQRKSSGSFQRHEKVAAYGQAIKLKDGRTIRVLDRSLSRDYMRSPSWRHVY